MSNNDGDDRVRGAAWTYIKPRGGFSKGTRWGLAVCAVLVLLLFLSIHFLGAAPGTAQAVLADALLGLLLAVAGVWVVGGIIELHTTLYDVSVKAGGGIAIVLLVAVSVRPIYYASGQVAYAESITINPWGTVGTIISHYNEQFARMQADAIHVAIPSNIENEVLRFRATHPPDITAEYKANWGFPRRNPKLRILDAIEERQECLSFHEGENGEVRAALDKDKLETKSGSRGGEEQIIIVCKRE